MPKLPIRIGDVNDKNMLAYAYYQNAKFEVVTDGNIKIWHDGGYYEIEHFTCLCGHFLDRGQCQHVYWAAQLHPCDSCGGVMRLGVYTCSVGFGQYRFECPDCGSHKTAEDVQLEREVKTNSVEA